MKYFARAWPWRLFIARSDAMRPSIFAGDVLVVRRPARNADGYGVGDIIAYDSGHRGKSPSVRRISMVMHPSNGITHYAVRRDVDGPVVESVVDASHVLGAVEARFVNAGRLFGTGTDRSKRSLSRWAAAPNARRVAHHTAVLAESLDADDHTASATESAAE